MRDSFSISASLIGGDDFKMDGRDGVGGGARIGWLELGFGAFGEGVDSQVAGAAGFDFGGVGLEDNFSSVACW